ncbi:hypothetical protein [Estrella lausannensis]|uniref:Uncharacterized protein n=1 Tax=Estrella lausannensis TaxID=483423 RepID=A0A0H5DQY6_9BACT|nr:hypothetical protein [Estrella lausannensis]CRX38034.1 hypothetical protein ELAC_0682 [Estrella lausannensis]
MINNNSINLTSRTDTLLQKYIESPSVRKFNESEDQRRLLAAIALELLDQNTANDDISKTSLDTATVRQFALSNESLAYLQLNCNAIFHVNTKSASQLATLWKSNSDDNKFHENMALLRTMINASEHIDNYTLLTIFHDIGLTPKSALWNYNDEPTELCLLLCQERSTSLDAFYKQTPPGLIVEMPPQLLPAKTVAKVAEVVAKPPYGYGHDTCIAKLHIGAKLENPSYPLLSVDAQALRKSLSDGSEILHLIAQHKYKKFSELEGYSATEKLLLLYLAKYELMSQVLEQQVWQDDDNEGYVTNLSVRTYIETTRTNLEALLEDLLMSETVDLQKLNLLLHALVYFSEDGACGSPFEFLEMLNSIAGGTKAKCIPLFHQTAERHGLLVSYHMYSYEAKVSAEESKMFVPILSRTGLFGANTFLSLFFNDLIPYSCSIRQFTGHELSVHDNQIQGHLDVLEHDIEHSRRTIPITRNKPWHDYLKYCYSQILENPQLAGQENLLFYLFFETARTNLDALLEDLLKSETVDLQKLNLLLHALVFFSEDAASNPPKDLWQMLRTITEKTTAECIPLFHQTAERHGFLVSSIMFYGQAKVTPEESKMFVPILSRTGLFGANTFLSLFFNDLIPYSCSIRQFTGHKISVHDKQRKGHLDVLEHDIEHSRRTIPITRNKPWHDYLKYCYSQILENPQLTGQENLLYYLFLITHELGMMPDRAAKFHEIIDARIDSKNRIQCYRKAAAALPRKI